MEAHTDRTEWAKALTLEAFRECGVRLRDNDSLLLVAVVFRKALESWSIDERRTLENHLVSMENASTDAAEGVRMVVAAEFGAQALKLRTALLADAQSASTTAENAVRKALAIPSRHDPWKLRAEGAFTGAALMLLGALIYHWLR